MPHSPVGVTCLFLKVIGGEQKASKNWSKENKNILVIARTDALTSGSLDEALSRSIEYKKLGADCIFITGINTLKQLMMVFF